MSSWPKKILILFTLLALTGGQWAVLQSAAWAGMLVSNLRKASIPTALSQTFDGQHPCPMCMAIQQGKKSEKKTEAVVKATQIEFPPTDFFYQFNVGQATGRISLTDRFCDSLSTAPLLRPPRQILV
jgi:hypothetical protein